MSTFTDAKTRLNYLAKADKALQREINRKCDWDNPLDVAAYRRDLRYEEREKLLNELVPRRVCPSCGRFVWGMRGWVINKPKTLAVCKSCYAMANSKGNKDNVFLDLVIFPTREVSYVVDGDALKQARLSLELSMKKFADKLGVHQTFISRLENGQQRTLRQDLAEMVMDTLALHNKMTFDAV